MNRMYRNIEKRVLHKVLAVFLLLAAAVTAAYPRTVTAYAAENSVAELRGMQDMILNWKYANGGENQILAGDLLDGAGEGGRDVYKRQILLLLETGRIKGTEKTDPSCLDALAEAILSVSQELISQQIVHTIGWQNHEENTFSSMEIETDEDLNIVLPGLLGAVPGEDEMSAAEHYLKTREQLEFAHVVLFTPQHRSALSFLADQCLLTEVLCEEGGAGYDRQDGISMIGTGPETMMEYLSYIEI